MKPFAPALGLAAIVAANAGWSSVAIFAKLRGHVLRPGADRLLYWSRAHTRTAIQHRCGNRATSRRYRNSPKQNRRQPYDKGSPSEIKANVTKQLVWLASRHALPSLVSPCPSLSAQPTRCLARREGKPRFRELGSRGQRACHL
jgi:hypothetical protein